MSYKDLKGGRSLLFLFFFWGAFLTQSASASIETPSILLDVESRAYHPQLNLQFEKPQGWQLADSMEDRHIVFQLVEDQASMSLMIRASFGLELDSFEQVVKDGIELTHRGASLLSEQPREFLKRPARQMTFTLSKEILMTIVCAVDETIGYIFSYSSDEAQFFEKMAAFEKVLRSLRFRDQNGLDPVIRQNLVREDYREIQMDQTLQLVQRRIPEEEK